MATDHFVRHSHQHQQQRHQPHQPQHPPPLAIASQHEPWSAMPPPLPPRPVAANGSYRRRCLPDRPPTAEVETMDCDDYGGCNAGGGGENRDLLELSPLAQPPPVTAATTATTNLPSLPHPDVTATGEELPPEMEEATQNWRQYAAAALFHGRRGTVDPSARISREETMEDLDDDMAEEEEDGGGFRERRTTVTYRFPTNNSNLSDEQSSQQQQRRRAVARKLSMGHHRHSAEERRGVDQQQQYLSPQQQTRAGELQQRRLSYPERSLLNANYAILRKSVDHFEVVGAFHRCHSEAYRHFLQSLTCYDLTPQHGLTVMLDAELTIQKAVQILCAHPAPRVAVIFNAKDSQWDMFTVTDCLLALHRAHSQLNAELGTLSLRHFVDQIRNGRRLVSVDDQSSVWDLSRVFALNRVHRVPVFSVESPDELVGILCPRAICLELLKLLNSKCSLSPDLHSIPIRSRVVGTWGPEEIASLTEGDTCVQAVNLFLERQVSALPVLASRDGSLLGVLDKNNLMDRLFERLGSHQTPERCFRLMEETPVEDLLPQGRRRTVHADISLADAMRLLTEDGLSESLFVVEPNTNEAKEKASSPVGGDRLCGVLSHTDILAFILNCEQQQNYQQLLYTNHQQMSASGSLGSGSCFPD